ncbi:MAG TPA: phenylalanine--tRNA ligase subunit beta, partial [Cytophagaceae bacterium]
MKISYNWLKQYISLAESPDKVAELLTSAGLEVEKTEVFETIKGGLKGVVLGKVVTCEKHPGADKLKKTTVDVGIGEFLPIICGASNVEAGQKVLVATVGTTLYPSVGEPLKISKAKIRGEVSEGMICAEDELGLGNSHEGIMVIDTDLPAGTAASEILNIESDVIFEIGLTPNRADAASHLGVARDLQAIVDLKVKLDDQSNFTINNTSKPIEVIIENSAACPRYSGLTISNVKVTSSPSWLQNRLKS